MFQGQIGEIAPLSPGKFGFFLIYPHFSTCPSQKVGNPTQLKLLFRINMEKGYPFKKFSLEKLKITVFISNCKKTVFNYVLCKKPLKHLVIEWLPWWQNKRYLINFTFYETFKD